jgi:hypothetical protein
MTIITAFPRCRTELACRWSATGRNKAQPFRQHCCPLPYTQSTAPTPLAHTHAGPSQRPNPHSPFAKIARTSPAGSFLGGFRTPAHHCASFVRRRRPEPFTIADVREVRSPVRALIKVLVDVPYALRGQMTAVTRRQPWGLCQIVSSAAGLPLRRSGSHRRRSATTFDNSKQVSITQLDVGEVPIRHQFDSSDELRLSPACP